MGWSDGYEYPSLVDGINMDLSEYDTLYKKYLFRPHLFGSKHVVPKIEEIEPEKVEKEGILKLMDYDFVDDSNAVRCTEENYNNSMNYFDEDSKFACDNLSQSIFYLRNQNTHNDVLISKINTENEENIYNYKNKLCRRYTSLYKFDPNNGYIENNKLYLRPLIKGAKYDSNLEECVNDDYDDNYNKHVECEKITCKDPLQKISGKNVIKNFESVCEYNCSEYCMYTDNNCITVENHGSDENPLYKFLRKPFQSNCTNPKINDTIKCVSIDPINCPAINGVDAISVENHQCIYPTQTPSSGMEQQPTSQTWSSYSSPTFRIPYTPRPYFPRLPSYAFSPPPIPRPPTPPPSSLPTPPSPAPPASASASLPTPPASASASSSTRAIQNAVAEIDDNISDLTIGLFRSISLS
jgi:hypothetical protein